MIYKTLVINAERKTKKMAAAIEKAANKMAKKGWDLVTFSFARSGKAVLVFGLDDYFFMSDKVDDGSEYCDDFGDDEMYDDESCECDDEEADLAADIEDLDADIEELEAEREELQAKIEELIAERDDLEGEKDALDEEKDADEIASLEDDVQDLEAEVESLESERDEIDAKIDDLSGERAVIEDEKEALEDMHLETEAAAEPEDMKKEEMQEEHGCEDAKPTETEQGAAEAAGEVR